MVSKHYFFILVLFSLHLMRASAQCTFPKGFRFGIATSAYQTEGNWNTSGKTLSIWDYATHIKPERIKDHSNGDIACDSYNQISTDIKNLKFLNVSFYRFSISWPRLLPNGDDNLISSEGFLYYNQLIDRLIENKIEPMVTIFHWDLPQKLEFLGGWNNRKIIDYYLQFAKICFQLFGDRVKTWLTFNEIKTYCIYGYDEYLAPFKNSPGEGTYLCAHYMLIAHGKAYHTYQTEFKKQGGKIGMAAETPWYYPATNSANDKMAARRAIITSFDWIVHPIFAASGDYHPEMRKLIDDASKREGRFNSRLPYFTQDEINLIQGSADFLGINHYTSLLVSPASPKDLDSYRLDASYVRDRNVQFSFDPRWNRTARDFYRVVPDGMRKILNYTKNQYNNPIVYITENGIASSPSESIIDDARVVYYSKYLTAVSKAIKEDGCNVKGFTAWSFLDNFEWADGYTLRFGLYHVDFNQPNRTRSAKMSAMMYKQIITSGMLDQCYAIEEEGTENDINGRALTSVIWLNEKLGPNIKKGSRN